ncbi:MAG: polysaccharide biosynthesis protein [Ruminococcaceae bacterium]|nr:polysaccharide biosynthesis protein [Oscillospiraceae bacterium]
MNRLRRFILNGLLMAIVAVIMRTVAVAFNVYISNKIGAVAMGLFSLISTVYGFALTFATSGINLATTRLVAGALGDTGTEKSSRIPPDKQGKINCILRRCICYSVIFGSIASVVLFGFAEFIGINILRDQRTVLSLKVLSVTLVPIAASSVLGGYFSAVRKVYKNAVTQILGQAAKIYACIALIALLGANDTESACLAVVAGGAIAELISFALGLIMYFLGRAKAKAEPDKIEKKQITKSVISNSLPLALSAYMRSALVTIEHILIPRGLEKSGSSRDMSLAAYGTVGSMVFPLVLFPSAITASFAGLLIPEVAESVATGDERRIKGIVCTVLETVLIFSIGCAGVIMSFSLELGKAVYPTSNTAGLYILMIAPLIPVMYLDTAVDSMLKGLGEHVYTMWVNIADAFISVILVAILLPIMGINGYIVTVYFTELINATLSITRLLTNSRVKTHVFLWVARPLGCIVVATKAVHLLINNVTPLGGVWAHIALSAVLYILLMIITGGIKPRVIVNSLRYISTHK